MKSQERLARALHKQASEGLELFCTRNSNMNFSDLGKIFPQVSHIFRQTLIALSRSSKSFD